MKDSSALVLNSFNKRAYEIDEKSSPPSRYQIDDERTEVIQLIKKINERGKKYSFWVIAWCCLIGDSSRGLLMPTLWPLVSSMGGNLIWQGIVVATFSLGRIISSPIMGHLADTYGYKWVLTGCNLIIMLGALIYTQSSSLPLLIFSQLVIGLGAGTLGVTRSYVAENSKKLERTEKMACLTAMQYTGFTVMPLMGAIFAFIGSRLDTEYNSINEYNFPAYVLCLMSFIEALVFIFYFNEQNRTIDLTSEEAFVFCSSPISETEAHVIPRSCPEKFVSLAILGCLLNASTKGTISVFETMGAQINLSILHGSVEQTGFIVSLSGAIGVVILINFKKLLTYLNDYDLMIIGMILMMVSCCFLGISTTSNFWLDVQFLFSIIIIYSIAYPVGHTAVLGMFSKIISDGPQGEMLGWFASAGSFARIIFPITAGFISNFYGDNLIFLIISLILLISIIVTIWYKSQILEMLNSC